MISGILEEMTIDDVRDFNPEIVVMGVASTEPHGPSMPYGADYLQTKAICRRGVGSANELKARVLMYPTLPIGNNVNFKSFPFACRIGVRTLMLMILDIIQALEEDGIRKIVLVNGHGGNIDTVNAVLREHYDKTPHHCRSFVGVMNVWEMPVKEVFEIAKPSPHGGEREACHMLYLHPELVKPDNFQDQPLGVPLLSSLAQGRINFVKPWQLHVPLSGGGDTRKATAEKGKKLIESAARTLADFLVELSDVPWKPGFPYSADA